MRTSLLLAAGPERSRADPERPATVHTWFLCRQADARFVVAVAQRHGLLGEEFRPIFLADDGIDHVVGVGFARGDLNR